MFVSKNFSTPKWGQEKENTFIGYVQVLEEHFRGLSNESDLGMDYSDFVGLSGYGFRFSFHDKWCPSSPDATCGFNCGEMLLETLGYKYSNMKKFDPEIVKKSLKNGFPVLAINLRVCPEWGIIVGYEDESISTKDNFYVKTYFHDGEMKMENTPFVSYIFSERNGVKKITKELFIKSIEKSKEMYETERYDNHYCSGICGFEMWIKKLQEVKDNGGETKNLENGKSIQHANWWIYWSLKEARNCVWKYLVKFKNLMKEEEEKKIDDIIELYKKEYEILQDGLKFVQKTEKWEVSNIEEQLKVLEKILGIEKGIMEFTKSV